jgi:uncharacterized delta-60 repeat protein
MLNHTQQAGDLDRDFGINGTMLLEGDRVQAIAVLKTPGAQQGKIIGVLRDGRDFKLFRLQKDGLIDTSFGVNGYLRWGFAGNEFTSIPTGITELSADKLLVNGYIQESGLPLRHYPAIARFNAGGSIDLTFAQSGVFVFKEPLSADLKPTDSQSDNPNVAASLSVTARADGRILLAYNSRALSPYRDQGLLIQLTPDGQLDNRFNQQGYAFFQIEQQSTASVGLAIRGNGNILVAGNSGNEGFVAEFNESGILNPSFATSGVYLFKIDGGTLRLSALLVQADDKPVVVGSFTTGGSTVKGYVNRLMPDGSRDPGFNLGHSLIVERPFLSLQLTCAELDNEQTIVIAGELTARTLSLAGRVTPQGSMDSTFGNDGLTDTSVEGILNFTSTIAIQPLRRIVLAGEQLRNAAVIRHYG